MELAKKIVEQLTTHNALLGQVKYPDDNSIMTSIEMKSVVDHNGDLAKAAHVEVIVLNSNKPDKLIISEIEIL